MKAILQLTLIVILWNYGATQDFSHEKCVELKNNNLHTPLTSIVNGLGEPTENRWYRRMDWMDTPAGDLTLTYKIENHQGQTWMPQSDGTVKVFSKGEGEAHDLADLVRRLLGVNLPVVKIPGSLRVPETIFGNRKCTIIRFKDTFHAEYKHRIFLHVEDDDGNIILDGHISIPVPKGY